MQEVELWTDGSCPRNPGPGGWCALLRFTDAEGAVHERELSGGEEATTNNRMEMTAVLEGLCAIKQPCKVTIFTDSTYLKDGMAIVPRWRENGWLTFGGRQPVKNKDLWSALLIATQVHVIQWVWVRGHDGNEHNERCDEMAGRVARSIMDRAEKISEHPKTTAQRVAEKQEAIALAPHSELDRELDRAVALDDERERAERAA